MRTFLLAILGVLLFAAFTILKNAGRDSATLSDMEKDALNTNDKDLSKLIIYCDFLLTFPLTQKNTNQTVELTTDIAHFSFMEAKAEVARLTLMSDIIMLGGMVFSSVLSNFNLAVMVGMFAVFLVIKKDFVMKRLKKERIFYWESLLATLRSIDTKYTENDRNLDKALVECITDEKTHLYISNLRYMVDNSYDTAALNKFILNNKHEVSVRLAHLLFHTKREGDMLNPVTMESAFTESLGSIIDDLDEELDYIKTELRDFSIPEKVPLLGILIMFAGPYFFTKSMPGLKYYFATPLGYFCFIIPLILVIGGYVYLSSINNHNSVNIDTTFLEVSYFSNPIRHKKWTLRLGDKRKSDYQTLLSYSLSNLSPEMLLFRKTVYSIIGFVIALVFVLFSFFSIRGMYLGNYKELTQNELNYIVSQAPEFDTYMSELADLGVTLDDETLNDYLGEKGYYLESPYSDRIIEIFNSNTDKYNSVYFKWYYLLPALFIGIACYFIPNFTLYRRRKLVNMVSLEELMLFYSLSVISMHSKWKITDYYAMFNRCTKLYRDKMYYYYVYSYNMPELIDKSLYDIKHSRYRSFVEKLSSTHHKVQPVDAFRTYKIDGEKLRKRYIRDRAKQMGQNLVKLDGLAIASLAITVIARLMIPLIMYVVDIYSSVM